MYPVNCHIVIFVRDFKLVCNQFIIWMLTSDVIYLRDNTVKAFTTLVQRNRNFIQVIKLDFSRSRLKSNLLSFYSGNI